MKLLTHKNKLTLKIIAFAFISLIGIFAWFYNGRSLLEFIIVSFLFGWLISIFGTIGSHRWLAHRSFEPTKLGIFIMMVGMIVESYGKPSQTVIAHRLHHKYTDQDGDPHSPKHLNFFQLWLGNFSTIESLPPIRDFLRIQEIQWFDKHYWKLWWVFNIVLILIDWQIALIFCPVVFTRSWILNQVINYHGHGGKNCEPSNLNRLLVYVTGGEGLHKNHHMRPGNYCFSDDTSPIDISSIFIKKILT
jgi:stearoyl-CoA desaturase (Delta-9 desaturase)